MRSVIAAVVLAIGLVVFGHAFAYGWWPWGILGATFCGACIGVRDCIKGYC